MLVITRKEREAFYVGDDVKITVLRCGRYTKIGIEAPKEVEVHREEIYLERKAEREKCG